jgi:uncharacterized membrane-anchored protein YjiN (DUF445 family)
MCFDIRITNIIEWIIVIFLAVFGWYIAIRSTIIQQKKERYNDLIQDFHEFVYKFRYTILPDLLSSNDKKYIIQDINHQIKFIYFKAKNLDSLTKDINNKIEQRIKKAGEDFTDSVLLDHDIEDALISSAGDERSETQRKDFYRFVDKFIGECYSITKFNPN